MEDIKKTLEEISKKNPKCVATICYSEVSVFATKKEGMDYFRRGMSCCDMDSSEYERYETIYMKLSDGFKVANDNCDDQDEENQLSCRIRGEVKLSAKVKK